MISIVSQMNYAQIRAFHRVAAEGSFSKAAASLFVTQPTISAQVKALERSVGVQLFDRRHVVPTDFGRSLLALTPRLFDLEDQVNELLSAGQGLDKGHIKLGTDSPSRTAQLLATYTQRYPGLTVSLATGNADEMLAALLDYRTDVAVVAKKSDDPRIEAFKLSEDPLVLFARTDHHLAKHHSLSLAKLVGQRIILREEGSNTRELFQRAATEFGLELTEVLEIDSREAVHEAVAAGLGVGVVAQSEVANDPRLKSIHIRDAKLIMVEYVLCLRERRGLPIVRAFLETARASVARA